MITFFFFLSYMILDELAWVSSLMFFLSIKKKVTKFKISYINITFWMNCVKWFRSKLFKSQSSVCHLPAWEADVSEYRFSLFLWEEPCENAFQESAFHFQLKEEVLLN